MQDLGPATDDQVILAWLQAEIESPRFQGQIIEDPQDHELLQIVREIAHQPDLNNADENEARRNLIGPTRGFGQGEHLFAGLANDVIWRRYHVTTDEIADMLYANHMNDWTALAPTTLTVREGAGHVGRVATPGGVNAHIFAVAQQICDTNPVPNFPQLIGLERPDGRISIIEGHVRATAYVLEAHRLPAGVDIYLGRSPSVANWHWL